MSKAKREALAVVVVVEMVGFETRVNQEIQRSHRKVYQDPGREAVKNLHSLVEEVVEGRDLRSKAALLGEEQCRRAE
jgi:hypothetical protein